MKLIAFITDFKETKKILKHIGEETQRAPPLSPKTVSVDETDSCYADGILIIHLLQFGFGILFSYEIKIL